MKLRTRIILLLIVAAFLPLFAVFTSLALYADKQRDSLVDMKLNTVYGGAVSLYERRGSTILSQMQQLAGDPQLLRYLLVKDKNGFIDQQGLIDFAVKMKGFLDLDYLCIVGPDGTVLARGNDPGFFGDDLSNDPVFSEALKGQKIQSLDKPASSGDQMLTSMGLAPIWYNNRQLIGVVAGGEFIDDDFCRNLRSLSGAEIMVIENGQLLAGTVSGSKDELELYLKHRRTYRTKIEGLWYTFSSYPLNDFSDNKVADLMMGVSTQDLDVLFGNMKLFYGGFSIGGLILAIIFGYFFSIGVTRPIHKLATAADSLAEGDFSTRINYDGKGELGNLIDAFNRMAADLEDYRRKIVESERLSAFTMMARKVAHEIKNPLTPIKIAVEDLRRSFASSDPGFSDDFQRSTKTVLEEVSSLTRIVEEFSDFAKFPPPKPEIQDLNEIVSNTLSLYKKEIDEKTVIGEIYPKRIPVYVDPSQIKRALVNLIKNGIESLGGKGRVVVRVLAAGKNASIVVADNGSGLSPQARQNLFNPYFTTKEGGSGLGLVIVKKIINENGGKIRIADSTEGGTAAVIELPIAQKNADAG